jgi:apyrase
MCGERLWKLRGMFILASIPIGLIFLVYTMMPTHSHLHRHHQLDFANVHPHGNEYASSSSSNKKNKSYNRYGGESSAANLARERAHQESDEYLSSSSGEHHPDGFEEPSSLHTAHEEEEDDHHVRVGEEEEEEGEVDKSASQKGDGYKYAIVFDAGSTGSRVHIFRFEQDTGKLVDDTFEQLKPGLSSYADEPDKAGASLQPLLEKAMETIPERQRAETPVEVRATAGLRLLKPQSKADDLLESVRETLKTYPFAFESERDVSIMGGEDEGAFQWLALNYLLNRLDGNGSDKKGNDNKKSSRSQKSGVTVAAIDLGGGSVQLAHAMDEKVAKRAPEGYSKSISFPGAKKPFEVYVKSHLGYGLMAARAATLKEANGMSSPCLPKGSDPKYVYSGEEILAAGHEEKNSDYTACREHVESMLKLDVSCEVDDECSFNGAWGGDFNSQHAKEVYLSSYMWDRAINAKLIPKDAIDGELTIDEIEDAAKLACDTMGDESEILTTFEGVEEKDAAFLCADLTYIVALLEKGFEKNDWKSVRLVKQIEYRGQNVEVAWALGAALNALASSS